MTAAAFTPAATLKVGAGLASGTTVLQNVASFYFNVGRQMLSVVFGQSGAFPAYALQAIDYDTSAFNSVTVTVTSNNIATIVVT